MPPTHPMPHMEKVGRYDVFEPHEAVDSMPVAITRDILVSVDTVYQGLVHGQHYFAYRITIRNQGDQTVRLLRRHWFITDVWTGRSEVEGDGVVGEQPVLGPGQVHQYVSGCPLLSGIGKMHGTYLMQPMETGKAFRVQIPEFVMYLPFILN